MRSIKSRKQEEQYWPNRATFSICCYLNAPLIYQASRAEPAPHADHQAEGAESQRG